MLLPLTLETESLSFIISKRLLRLATALSMLPIVFTDASHAAVTISCL